MGQPRFVKEFLPNGDYRLVPNTKFSIDDGGISYGSGKRSLAGVWRKAKVFLGKNASKYFGETKLYLKQSQQPKKVKVAKIVKSNLVTFWLRFNNAIGENEKINILKEYADLVVIKRTKKSLRAKRGKFVAHRTYKRLFKQACKVCKSRPVIRHHIIELQYGGNNSRLNIIPICSYCHSLIHEWLNAPKPVEQLETQ